MFWDLILKWGAKIQPPDLLASLGCSNHPIKNSTPTPPNHLRTTSVPTVPIVPPTLPHRGADAEGAHAADQVKQPSVGHDLVALLNQRASAAGAAGAAGRWGKSHFGVECGGNREGMGRGEIFQVKI
jgi:hypothetical protein